MSITKKIDEDWKAAFKAGDPAKVALSSIRSEFKKAAIELGSNGRELDDAQAITVLGRMAKQRKESAEEYTKGAREDLAATELSELAVIQKYLPAQLSAEELRAMIAIAIKDSGATTVQHMGKVMKILSSQIKGKADGKQVKEMVEAALGAA